METLEITSCKGLAANTQVVNTVTHLAQPKPRICLGSCGQWIPEARLRAIPNARMCVSCLDAAGDVAPIRRFDQEGTETYYTPDHGAIAREIKRRSRRISRVKEDAPERSTSLAACNLPSAILEQRAALQRQNSERMRAVQERKSLK